MKDSCEVQKQFSCGSCWYRCKTKSQLRDHKRVHKEKTFQCPQCGFKAQYKCRLDLHNLIHSAESRERPFVCTHSGCTHSSSRARDLVTHQLVHSNLKPFKCNLCGKYFRQTSHLNYHIQTHTGEKPYRCFFKDCQYSSARSGNLQAHFRRHTGEKPFRCSYEACEYSSPRAHDLKRHMMTHNDGKVYTCSFEECKYSSNIKDYLRNHYNRVHLRNKRHVCQSCVYWSETAAELKRHIAHNHQIALQTSINRRHLKSSKSSSLNEIESTNSVSHSKLIKSFDVDEDPKLIVRTFAFVRLTRLKPDNCSYSKNITATSASAQSLEASRDPLQNTKSRTRNYSRAEGDPKLRIPTVVVLKKLQVNYDSDHDFIGDSSEVQADLTVPIPTVSDYTDVNTEPQKPQTGSKRKPKKAYLYTRKICDYETNKFTKYKSHLQAHRKKREFFCPLCDFVGFKRKLLKFHLRTHGIMTHDSSN